MMKNSIRKVGTTFLGLSCLLGGVLTFTGCETYEEQGARLRRESSESAISGVNYKALANQVEVKLTKTYNVDTVKLYNACMEMIRDYKGFADTAKNRVKKFSYNIELKVVNSDKPSKAGESGYISLEKGTAMTTRVYCYGVPVAITNNKGEVIDKKEPCTWGEVSYEPTLYIEKGSSENTSILTIKPRFKAWYQWRYDESYYTYQYAMDYYNLMFESDFANSILEGVQNCIR